MPSPAVQSKSPHAFDRDIRNDHAVAMYDRAVEDLARVGRDIRAEASIQVFSNSELERIFLTSNVFFF